MKKKQPTARREEQDEHVGVRPPTRLPTRHPKTGNVLVVVETPKGSRNKYKYDEAIDCFTHSAVLPEGQAFPFDFGFVPRTRGEDGDPLDVLLLMDAPVAVGCVVPAKLVGLIEAEQTEDGGKPVRNDRILAVASETVMFAGVRSLDDLSKPMLEQIEQFFVNYNRAKGKKFTVKARRGPAAAARAIDAGREAYQKADHIKGD